MNSAFSVDSLEIPIGQSEASVHFLDSTLSTEIISEISVDSVFGHEISCPIIEPIKLEIDSTNSQISEDISNLPISKLAKTNPNAKLTICGIVILLIVSILCVIGAKVGQLENRIHGMINETKLAKLENDQEMYKFNYRLTQTALEGIQNWLENTISPKT